mmetsp:Transcript_7875/g.14001  ORF Transcript_7875/g.14001 Transcript_7875/m.14001 type:complete len:658 (-) Transcript_7875:196-2169(-)
MMLGPTIFDGPNQILSPYAVSPLHPSAALLNSIDPHPLSPNTPQTPTSPGDYSDTPLTPNAEAVENDAHKIQQRLKQIGFGKSTKGYKNYINKVPKETGREKDNEEHPVTPRADQKCSKRSWDGQMKKWRRLLHRWDPVTEDGAESEEGGLDHAQMQAQLRNALSPDDVPLITCLPSMGLGANGGERTPSGSSVWGTGLATPASAPIDNFWQVPSGTYPFTNPFNSSPGGSLSGLFGDGPVVEDPEVCPEDGLADGGHKDQASNAILFLRKHCGPVGSLCGSKNVSPAPSVTASPEVGKAVRSHNCSLDNTPASSPPARNGYSSWVGIGTSPLLHKDLDIGSALGSARPMLYSSPLAAGGLARAPSSAPPGLAGSSGRSGQSSHTRGRSPPLSLSLAGGGLGGLRSAFPSNPFVGADAAGLGLNNSLFAVPPVVASNPPQHEKSSPEGLFSLNKAGSGKSSKVESNPEFDAERLSRTVLITVTGLDPSAAKSQDKSHSLKYMLGSYLAKEAGTVDRISVKAENQIGVMVEFATVEAQAQALRMVSPAVGQAVMHIQPAWSPIPITYDADARVQRTVHIYAIEPPLSFNLQDAISWLEERCGAMTRKPRNFNDKSHALVELESAAAASAAIQLSGQRIHNVCVGIERAIAPILPNNSN